MLQSYTIIEVLRNEEAKAFIVSNLNNDVSSLALKYSKKVHFNLNVCLELIRIYQKSRKKLPTYSQHVLALTDRSYQQSTSERVAQFKAQLIKGNRLLDLSAGLGVDDQYFCKSFKEVVAVDTDEELNALTKYNLEVLGITNIRRKTGLAEDQDLDGFDWIYLDPDRRVKQSKAVSLLDMVPDVVGLVPRCIEYGISLAVKLSPLFEVKEILKQIPEVTDLYVLSENNEVKEVLFMIDKFKAALSIHAVNVGNKPFSFQSTSKAWDVSPEEDSNVRGYVHLPSPALIKSRLAGQYAAGLNLKVLASLPIYHSQEERSAIGFRTLEVLSVSSPSKKKIIEMLKAFEVRRADIMLKGTSQRPEKWYKDLKLRTGGNHLLIIVLNPVKQAILCRSLL